MKYLFLLLLVLAAAGPGAAQHQSRPQTRTEALEKANGVQLFSGVDGLYFDLEYDPSAQGALGYRNILGWLQGRVAGLQLYYYRGIPVPYIRSYPAALYLDEIRVDPATISVLPVNDIALIKVMKGPVAIAGTAGGAIAIYTKGGPDDEEEQ